MKVELVIFFPCAMSMLQSIVHAARFAALKKQTLRHHEPDFLSATFVTLGGVMCWV